MRKTPFQLFVLLSLFMLAACGSSGNPASSASKTPTPVTQPTSSIPPTVSVDCPAPGTARAAVLSSFSAGSDQNIVYILNTNSAGTLFRYDVATGVKTQIVSETQTSSEAAGVSSGGGNLTNISDAVLSPDGQWVLSVEVTATQTRLQLVRLDGQGLQTLYCSKNASNGASNVLSNVQWSPNGRLAAFETYDSNANLPNQINVLNLSTGKVQTLFANRFEYPAVRWLDNTRLYLDGPTVDSPSQAFYLLDSNKGPDQSQDTLLTVFQVDFANPCWDATSSFDRSQVFISKCVLTNTGNSSGPGWDTQEGPGSLSVASATGGSLQSRYTNSTLGLVSVRAVTQTTLLVLVDNYSADGSADASQNGIWKLSTNGSSFTRLTTQGKNQRDILNVFTQDSWANGSRDGQFYSLTVDDTAANTTSLVFGKFSGGDAKPFATAPTSGNLPSLAIIGWTTD